MTYDLVNLFNLFLVKNADLQALKIKIEEAFDDSMNLDNILQEQLKYRKQVTCYTCDDEGLCSAIIGFAQLVLGRHSIAIREFEDANTHFANKADIWNNIIGLELQGWAYEEYGNRHQATLEYQQALRLLNQRYLPTHKNEYDKNVTALEEDIKEHLAHPVPSRIPPMSTNLDTQDPITKLHEEPFDISYFITPNVPIFGGVSAGPYGVYTLDEPDYLAANDVNATVRLEGNEYKVYSIKVGDRQISISMMDFLTSILSRDNREKLQLEGTRYGWLKVMGNSMNHAVPVTIQNGDFILFQEFKNKDDCIGKIIVAAVPSEDPYGSNLAVKRLIKIGEKYLLRSESNFVIDPITGVNFKIDLDFDEGYQVMGIVIAVAKPV